MVDKVNFEPIDPHELRYVLLGVRELMGRVTCRTVLRELRDVHDRISEIKIAVRSCDNAPKQESSAQ